MIDRVQFDPVNGGPAIRPYEDLGILMKNYNISPATPKIYQVTLDGADGALDLTEWAGDVKYEDRTVQISFRDMLERYLPLVQALNGRKWRITFADDPHWYYEGRCNGLPNSVKQHVTDMDVTFTCSPWKMKHFPTVFEKDVGGETQMVLRAERKRVIPTVKLTDACTLTWKGVDHALAAGTHTPSWFVLTDAYNQILTVSGSGKATVSWRDGVL